MNAFEFMSDKLLQCIPNLNYNRSWDETEEEQLRIRTEARTIVRLYDEMNRAGVFDKYKTEQR